MAVSWEGSALGLLGILDNDYLSSLKESCND